MCAASSLLTAALDCGQWSTWQLGERRVRGPHSLSRCFGEEKCVAMFVELLLHFHGNQILKTTYLLWDQKMAQKRHNHQTLYYWAYPLKLPVQKFSSLERMNSGKWCIQSLASAAITRSCSLETLSWKPHTVMETCAFSLYIFNGQSTGYCTNLKSISNSVYFRPSLRTYTFRCHIPLS